VKIGLVTTLTEPLAYAGRDIVDGFKLAIDLGKGALGGVPVTLLVEDDGMKPSQGRLRSTG
jgi:branched-chain amino acid transport system substrate-binding protein